MKQVRLLCCFLFINYGVQCQVIDDYSYSSNRMISTYHFAHLEVPNLTIHVYRIQPIADIPVELAGIAGSLYGFSKIYNRDTSTVAEILALDKNNIAAINRSGTHRYSPKAFNASNRFFYGAMPFPLVLMFDRTIRQDAGKIAFLYLQALGVTGTLYSTAALIHPKYRPYAYNPEAPISRRVRGGAKNSFYAGHVALVGTATFFTAKVFADYHPSSPFKWVLYSVAGVSTAMTGYLRYRAGEHFPTDALIGGVMGTLSGLLIPQLHKHLHGKKSAVTISPYGGKSKGLEMVYNF